MTQVNLGQNQGFRLPEPIPNREEEYIGQHNLRPLMVQRNQDADQVLRHVQQNNFGGDNNIANVVEQILAQNSLNVRLHRPNFISSLLEYLRQTKFPKDWKVPKFTKFVYDTSESTIEHVVGYQTEVSDIANNENLKMKYFPNSQTKTAFTWFATLPPHSV